MSLPEKEEGFAESFERGGIYLNLRAKNVREALAALVNALPPNPAIPADKLLQAALEREALMSTGIGGGIALPHPRSPLPMKAGEQFAALAFLENPVDWNSLDGKGVDTLFLIVSVSAKQHLQTLSEIAFFCRQEDFCRMLKERAPREELLRFIREAEKNWK